MRGARRRLSSHSASRAARAVGCAPSAVSRGPPARANRTRSGHHIGAPRSRNLGRSAAAFHRFLPTSPRACCAGQRPSAASGRHLASRNLVCPPSSFLCNSPCPPMGGQRRAGNLATLSHIIADIMTRRPFVPALDTPQNTPSQSIYLCASSQPASPLREPSPYLPACR